MPCARKKIYGFMHGASIKQDSCYNIWERLGNEGESNFLQFLRSGNKGDTGISAYQKWLLEDGNSGKSFSDFISINLGHIGDKGPTGDPGLYPDLIEALVINDDQNSKKMIVIVDGEIVIADYFAIEITTPPTKTDYTDTELFDPTGMVVTLIDESGSTVISDYEYDEYVTTGSSTHEIRYTKNGVTRTALVDITTLSLVDALEDFYYDLDEEGDYHITGWKETYHGIPSTECILPNSDKVVI